MFFARVAQCLERSGPLTGDVGGSIPSARSILRPRSSTGRASAPKAATSGFKSSRGRHFVFVILFAVLHGSSQLYAGELQAPAGHIVTYANGRTAFVPPHAVLIPPMLADISGGSAASGGLETNAHTITDAATNTITNVVTLYHNTSGTPAAGYGGGLLFVGPSATVADRDLARITGSWTTATDATRDSTLDFYTVLDGTTAKRAAVRAPSAASHISVYAADGTLGASLFAFNASISGILSPMAYLRLYGGTTGFAFGYNAGDGNAPTETGITSGTGWRFGNWTNPTGALEASNNAEAKPIFRALDGTTAMFTVGDGGNLQVERTVTVAGTTGAQTINKAAGTVNFAAAATSLVVTNSLVDASSIVYAVMRTNDGTCALKSVVPGSGSFTINVTAGCAAETSFGFLVVN